MVGRKPSMGRRKIEIKPIQNEVARQVCFTKRRKGIFNKASELTILCGAKIGVLTFSPAGRPFSFGHPSVGAVTDCFLAGDRPPAAAADDPARAAAVCELTRPQAELTARLEAEKRRGDRLKEAVMAAKARLPHSWGEPLDTVGLEELEEYQKALAELKAVVARRTDQILREARPRLAFPGPSTAVRPVIDGGSFVRTTAVRPAIAGGSFGPITRP